MSDSTSVSNDRLLDVLRTHDVLREVAKERVRQDQQWGGPEHDDKHGPEDWSEYIEHQLGMADDLVGSGEDNTDAMWRERMIKIAALAVAAVESLDRHIKKHKGG